MLQGAQIMKSFSKRGFTLVELLVVIVIIIILASVIIPAVMGVANKREIIETKALIKNLGETLEAYYDKTHRYPNDLNEEGPDGTEASGGAGADESYLYVLQHVKSRKKINGTYVYYRQNFMNNYKLKETEALTSKSYYIDAMRMTLPGDDKESKLIDLWLRPIEYRKMPQSLADYRIRFDETGTKAEIEIRYREFVAQGKKYHIWSYGPGQALDNVQDQKYRGPALNPKNGVGAGGFVVSGQTVGTGEYFSGGNIDDIDGEMTLNIGNWNLN